MEVKPEINEYEWKLDTKRATVLAMASVLMGFVGLLLFSQVARAMRPQYELTLSTTAAEPMSRVVLTAVGVIVCPLIGIFAILAFHEWCHGLAFRWMGVKPKYGSKIAGNIMPVFYATAPGKWVSRNQYLVIALAPTVIVNAVGLLLMWPPTILRFLLVFALAVHFAGCVGDWWMSLVVWKLPARTLVEDRETGFAYRL